MDENRPFVPFLLAFFAGFAADLVCFFVLLRNKPILLFAPFCSELEQVIEAFMEGPLVGGLVAEIEREMGVAVASAVFVEADALEIESTLGQPVMLGHAINE